MRVTASDPTGLVEVTVDSTGALVDLKLTERMRRTEPAVVAGTIMATLRDARGKLADRSQEIVADTVGTESPAARAIAELRNVPPRRSTMTRATKVAPCSGMSEHGRGL